jgi:hypothetical protein
MSESEVCVDKVTERALATVSAVAGLLRSAEDVVEVFRLCYGHLFPWVEAEWQAVFDELSTLIAPAWQRGDHAHVLVNALGQLIQEMRQAPWGERWAGDVEQRVVGFTLLVAVAVAAMRRLGQLQAADAGAGTGADRAPAAR